ncbi:MAG: hypothetical protein [Caudoviricetes sp.]|nr:MAG: hypothetical protein [Caudoviricetes sp.]
MANVSKGNKNAATEDEIGVLHAMVTKIFKRKLGKWIELMEEGGDPDLIVDMKQLNNVIKFIGDNGIICTDPAADDKSELRSQIDDIKEAQRKRLERQGFQEQDDNYQEFG